MANLVRFDPFVELEDLRKQFFGEDWFTPYKGATLPTTDVYERGNELIVEAHLPNFDDKDVDVHVESGTLVIQAQRHEREEDKDKKFVVRESASSLYRRILLPDRADASKIEARLEDGLLKVTVPLQELPQPKRIAIQGRSKK